MDWLEKRDETKIRALGNVSCAVEILYEFLKDPRDYVAMGTAMDHLTDAYAEFRMLSLLEDVQLPTEVIFKE